MPSAAKMIALPSSPARPKATFGQFDNRAGRQEGPKGQTLTCGPAAPVPAPPCPSQANPGPGELRLDLPGDEAPEVLHGAPVEEGNDFIAGPSKFRFTILGFLADHPDVLRSAKLGSPLDPRHVPSGTSRARQNNNHAALVQSKRDEVVPFHDGGSFFPDL